jgi:hypothetical protein
MAAIVMARQSLCVDRGDTSINSNSSSQSSTDILANFLPELCEKFSKSNWHGGMRIHQLGRESC